MDAVHAQVSVAGDDYFVRDAQSTSGTFLCLSTQFRHFPQRDGFRLRRGDVFRIGPTTSIRVVDLQTTTDQTSLRSDKSRSNSCSSLTIATEQSTSLSDKFERSNSTRSIGNGTSRPVLKRMSTVEELRLLAADIEDELMNDDGRYHSKMTPGDEVSGDNKDTFPVRSKKSVRFNDTPPLMSDGTVFLGSRYLRPEVKELHYHEPSQVEDADDDMIKQLVGSEHDPPESNTKPRRSSSIRLVIFQHDPTNTSAESVNPREVTLPGQATYLIGSSTACDVRILPSEGIKISAVHAKISFDGASFVLQDVSFERDPQRQTRVLLTQRPVRVTRGDWLLLGTCALYVTTVTRAFDSDRRPDMKEAAMRLDVLRLSKRKPRTKGLFVPVGFRLHSASGSGASSGSSGWGGSSGGPVTFGKGRDCDAQVFTASLSTEQFSVQLERGTCMITSKPTGLNAGTYFLIGRDEVGADNADDTEAEIVKHTSKPLLLSEGCVFRCGGCEVEVICVKNSSATKTSAAIEQQHVLFLSAMSWLQPIVNDEKTIANVARCGQRMTLSSGDMVYEKGDAANVVFIVISGEIDLHVASTSGTLIQQVTTGGFFGEVSLEDPFEACTLRPHGDGLEYLDTARATAACELLALAREDVCGYLELYMEVIRAHLKHDRRRDRIIRAACTSVPWLQGILLREMQILAAQAEVVVYPAGSTLFEDGKLFVPATFAVDTFQIRDGLLVLNRGNAQIVRSKHEKQRRKLKKTNAEGVDDVHDEAEDEPIEWWSLQDPVVAMSSSSFPSVLDFGDLSFRLKAYSSVECYFIAAAHLVHLIDGMTIGTPSAGSEAPLAAQMPSPMKRNKSGRRIHDSQVVTSALHSDGSGDDDNYDTLDGSDGEGDSTAVYRWRRKKRNKQLLDQIVQETQNDAQISNAMVLYVLAGAQRGDIHVVRNVASVGGLLSGADIELNDRYVSRTHAVIEYHDSRYWLYDNGSKWGTFVRLEEDNAVDINPGDVFLAGEIEFTCLASYPERNKASLCCVM
ncbi:FHA(forkhead-associated) domain-containing protein [Phytophthora infestans]|uniref:FHA(Forkhead-associated) domain-containing protein n=1 Tax=Phytophthora infestans TaxID=4787 RepID=A0A8S9UK14_PHYIN|nr:FHA(forkhead-associated) domain-containing protein [Phytophthora infestans]